MAARGAVCLGTHTHARIFDVHMQVYVRQIQRVRAMAMRCGTLRKVCLARYTTGLEKGLEPSLCIVHDPL